MSAQMPCKRFWEGPVGIALMPRKQQSGEYFWTFAFTRAFKRHGQEHWEYTDIFGQKHATRLGNVMSKAMQFMEHNRADEFTERWFADSGGPQHQEPPEPAPEPPAAAANALAELRMPAYEPASSN